MDPADVEQLIEEGVPDATATVDPQRGPEDDHFVALVVSPAFEGESILDRHSMVQTALGDALAGDIHAIDLTTRTPEEHRTA